MEVSNTFFRIFEDPYTVLPKIESEAYFATYFLIAYIILLIIFIANPLLFYHLHIFYAIPFCISRKTI